MSLNESPIELFGKSFSRWWSSWDRRSIVAGRKCYKLVSFSGGEQHDQELLAKGRLVQIQKVFVPNPEYQRAARREIAEWEGAFEAGFAGPLRDYLVGERSLPRLPVFQHMRNKAPPEKEGYYVPPHCWALQLVLPREFAAMMVHLPRARLDSATPGLVAYRTKLRNGVSLYLQGVEPCDIPGDAVAEFAASDQEKMQQIGRLLWEKDPFRAAQMGVPPPSLGLAPAPIQKGKLKYTKDFMDVWFEDTHYDLRTRNKARFCIQYLVQEGAFSKETARHLTEEIDPYVIAQANLPPSADIKIQHYFTDSKDSRKKLQTLCRKLIRAAGRNARFYLAVE